MKAAYKPNREKGIKIVDVPIPKISENEVLVKVKKSCDLRYGYPSICLESMV